jgi:hypothetical protein
MADNTEFEFILNRFELAAQAEHPSKENYAEHRQALVAYVRNLERIASMAGDMVLVPKEPTEAMLHAYATAWNGYEIRGTTLGQRGVHEYRAMIAAYRAQIPKESP